MSEFDAQKLGRTIQAKRAQSGLRETAVAIGVSASTLFRLEQGKVDDIKALLLACDWLQRPLQEFILQEETMAATISPSDLIAQIRHKCERESWYGPYDFRPNQNGRVWPINGFWCPPATQEQVRLTKEILGVELPSVLVALYTTLANGGFGPGAGLRGIVGGYGTRYTAAPGGETFLNEESLVKYQYEQLVPLTEYSWQQREGENIMSLPDDRWPEGILPICDLGDCQEVCTDTHGHVYYWYLSAQREGFSELKDTGMALEHWLYTWSIGV